MTLMIQIWFTLAVIFILLRFFSEAITKVCVKSYFWFFCVGGFVISFIGYTAFLILYAVWTLF